MALVDLVRHRLADQMIRDRMDLQPMLLQQRLFLGAIIGLRIGPAHLEVIPPAGQLQAVIAKRSRLGSEGFERQIGPLAGEEGDGAGHGGWVYG